MPRVLPALAIAAAAAAALASSPSSAQTRTTKLLRFPDVHGDRVVFSYAGDIWIAPSAGGTAARLTAHEGIEVFPKFSPDGKTIAFTGQYDGDEQVYAMPAEGGPPQRLTYYPARGPFPPRWGYDNQVYGFTNDGKAVLFRSMRESWSQSETRLYTVPLTGGLASPLPMPVSGAGAFSPDGTKVVYSPLSRDFRTWKRYEGGWAQDLFVFDLATAAISPVAHSKRTERDPMWIGGRIYFVSDRDGTLNLYSAPPSDDGVEQLTHSRTWDVRWASQGESGEIVYEFGGELRIFDTRTREDRAVPIFVPDDGVSSRPSRVDASSLVEGYALSPKGERAVIAARGDVFTVPAEKGPIRNLTRTSGTHDKGAAWSPDGSRIVFISDRSGEEELYSIAQDGSGELIQLTDGGAEMRYAPSFSPDGSRLAFTDKSGRLYSLTIETKAMVQVARDKGGNVSDFTWSPDSKWLAFSLSDENGFRSLHLWGVDEGRLRRVTGEEFNESEPVWDPDGKYLYYFSDREYAPQISNVEWNFAGNKTTGIFAMALRKDVPHPFPPQSDEVKVEEKPKEEKKAEEKKAEEKKEGEDKAEGEGEKKPEKEPLRIDFDGIETRVARVPVPPDNYRGLLAGKGSLFYVKTGPFYYGRPSGESPSLLAFDVKERKVETISQNAGGYVMSPDGSKLLVREGGSFSIYDATPKGAGSKKALSTAGMWVDRVPKEEWRQIFGEVWRRFRDFFYVENLHGYDWRALRERYEPLLEHVAHRSDLNYLIGEMIAELNVSHAYITGGEWRQPERVGVALLGARLALDPAAGRYRVAKILRGQNEEAIYRSPLTEIGAGVSAGDYVLAIDGEELKADDNPYRLLRGKADTLVTIEVGATPDRAAAKKVTIEPIGSEQDLAYLDMVLTNRERVARLTEGRIGYIHVPNMSAEGIREFIKWYYGQIRKEGLVVDVRSNGGGNVSQMLIERLRRTLLGTEYSRNSEFTDTYPAQVFHGPMACILDENSSSDGDIFPWMFRTAGLGPLVGKRSWGGVVGITNRGPLIDGGGVNVPEFGHANADGSWAVEGYGVDPDIVVENDPRSIRDGRDPQLERAVEEVMKKLGASPAPTLPPRPAPPVKTQ